MNFVTGKIFKIMLAAVLVFNGTCSFAATNSVSGINISRDSSGQYKIILKTDKTAQIKKTFDDNKLLLSLSSAVPSDSAEIIYDNAPGIENVTLQKKNSDSTLVVLQGENLQNADILNKDLSTGKTYPVATGNKFFVVADKKLLFYSMMTMLFLFALMIVSRPKEKRFSDNNIIIGRAEARKRNDNITLRQKAMLQSMNSVSLNSKMSGSFVSSAVSVPEDFNAAESVYGEEVRKAG